MTEKSAGILKYVFGPVPSRRLGRSLGVDLAPRKVCSFDCIYCQVGRTTRRTTQREHFIPVEHILAEVREKLRAGPRPDYITLSGSGEPTLNADIGEIIAGIKDMTDVPVAVITNGSLFYDPDVRRACARADVVLPTLDAPTDELFQAIHRPAPELTLEKVVEGLAAFRREYTGQIWLEVFIVAGMNSDPQLVRRLGALIERVAPDRIQLNTAVRPTADAGVQAPEEDELGEIAALLGPKAEVVADFRRPDAAGKAAVSAEAVLDMVRRRPVTLDDVASGLGIAQAEAERFTRQLLNEKRIRAERRGGKEYFCAL